MTSPEITYTDRTYENVRASMMQLVKARYANSWLEFTKTDIAMAILDVVAYSHGQSSYYLDMIARNVFSELADLPEAIGYHAKQFGYERKRPTPASVAVTLYPSPPQVAAITINKGEKATVGDLTFEAAETYVIPAGKSSWPDDSTEDIIVFVEGESFTDTFVSDGTSYQTFQLLRDNIIQGSIVVTILDAEWKQATSLINIEGTARGRDIFTGTGLDYQVVTLEDQYAIIDPNDEDCLVVYVNGEMWSQVENYTDAPKEFIAEQTTDGETIIRFGRLQHEAAPTDQSSIDVIYMISGPQKRYTATYNSNGRVAIKFGDGNAGVIPLNGATVTVAYRVGGGVAGNLERGEMDYNVRGYLPSGSSINVRAYNHEAGTGGNPIETLESVKLNAPKFATTNRRAVTKTEFDIISQKFSDPVYGSPTFTSAKLKRSVPEENTVEIAVWSRDSAGRLTTPSTPLKRALKNHMRTRALECVPVEIIDGAIIYFDVEAIVKLTNNRTPAAVVDSVTTLLQTHFNSTFVIPGQDLSLTLIAQKIMENRYISLATLTRVYGSKLETIDKGVGDNATVEFSDRFVVEYGTTIVPGTFKLTAGEQTISDDGSNGFQGDIDTSATKIIDYDTGYFIVSFSDPPSNTTYITAEARTYAYMHSSATHEIVNSKIDGILSFQPIVERRPIGICGGITVNLTLPEEFLPYSPYQVVFIGGYDNYGTQPGGNIIAKDDGEGNIVGDVQPGGEIDYDTGVVNFTWNTTPPPVSTTTYYGRLLQAPDGSRKEFDYEVRTASGGGGSAVNLATEDAIGRTKYVLSDLTTSSVTIYDAWDSSQGQLDGESLNKSFVSTVTHDASPSTGTLHFVSAPEAAAGQDFMIQKTPMTLLLYTAFSSFIMGTTDYDIYIFADNLGRFHGDVGELYPYGYLDHRSGRYKTLIATPSTTGRTMQIRYDPFMESNCKDIPIDHQTMPSFSTVSLEEMPLDEDIYGQ
jgi:hypothetical protein